MSPGTSQQTLQVGVGHGLSMALTDRGAHRPQCCVYGGRCHAVLSSFRRNLVGARSSEGLWKTQPLLDLFGNGGEPHPASGA